MSLSDISRTFLKKFFQGKSTLMNTLFNTSFDDDPRPHDLPGVRLRANSYELQETNVRLKLTLVDTVGFGDQINKDQSYKVSFIFGYLIFIHYFSQLWIILISNLKHISKKN